MVWVRTLLLLLALSSPALAQDGQRATADATEAAETLQHYLADVAKSDGRPDYTKPPASDLFKRIFDADRLAALPEPQASDAKWLPDWTRAATETSSRLILFGMSRSPPIDQDRLMRNLLDYEAQYAQAMNVVIRLEARQAVATMMLLGELPPEQLTPVRMSGLKLMRDGVTNVISGNLKSMQDMKPANLHLVSQALKDTRDVWASFLLSDQRADLVQESNAMPKASIDDQARRDLAEMAAALAAKK